MATDVTKNRSRRETFTEAIINRRILICVFTGFTSGLPLYLLFQLVPGWLRVQGVGLAEIGFFALVQFPYTWKFLWSPFMDRFTLPFLGHRRGWMLVTQLALLISMGAMGFLKPDLSLWTIAYLSVAVAFFSASQDIVLDAYRRELLPDVELGLGNSIHASRSSLYPEVPVVSRHGPLHATVSRAAPWLDVRNTTGVNGIDRFHGIRQSGALDLDRRISGSGFGIFQRQLCYEQKELRFSARRARVARYCVWRAPLR